MSVCKEGDLYKSSYQGSSCDIWRVPKTPSLGQISKLWGACCRFWVNVVRQHGREMSAHSPLLALPLVLSLAPPSAWNTCPLSLHETLVLFLCMKHLHSTLTRNQELISFHNLASDQSTLIRPTVFVSSVFVWVLLCFSISVCFHLHNYCALSIAVLTRFNTLQVPSVL